MSGATFAAAFLIIQEFQFARGYSPVSTGMRLLPFFATPMLVSPAAGAVSDRIGRRPVMVTGLTLQALGFTWVAVRGSLATSWIELTLALLVAGIGISMALPTVPTAVLSAVTPPDMGKASGLNQMAQRLGTVFVIAIGSAVFSAHGRLGNPATVTAGFRPALWSCVIFAALAAMTAVATTSHTSSAATGAEMDGVADIIATVLRDRPAGRDRQGQVHPGRAGGGHQPPVPGQQGGSELHGRGWSHRLRDRDSYVAQKRVGRVAEDHRRPWCRDAFQVLQGGAGQG